FLVLREKQTRREDALAAEKLRCLAENDSLTGLLNRQSFLIQAQEMLNQAQSNQYALCYLDIDRFKIINDLFGHEQGDQLLCFVAERLRRITGGRGFCCRVFADYFAACVPNRPDIFQGLLQICAVDLKQYPLPCELSASMGIYIIDDPMLPMETMLDRAALARKAIKDNYNQYVAYYDDSMRNKLIAEQEILGLMNSAIENHQFILHLQPQYNHISGQIIGAEALVRWQHPDRGLLYPGAFVPILEHNGFIARLDEYVWEETCKLLRRWLDQGRIPMPLGVNVSRVDIYRSDLCGVIVGLTEKYDIPRTLLRLEITESAYVENPEQLINTVGKLQQAGFLIEMDDFGSGYSSLNTLKDVPVDMIKLDMKFLSGGDGQRRKTLILKNVIQMAKDLGLPVIAEGVETKEQADLLRSF
ncbi:MAG: bifunctional diguanylate cyclase/phosphodiesterase, partial [Clostridiales bacterium]